VLPAWALAQSNGLVVEPGDRTLLTRAPREVVTTVIRVTNRTGAGALFEPRLLLPSGWRAITPGFPFRVADGETAVRLLSFLIPEHTPAGDYRVRYQVEQRSRPAVSGGVSLAVRVKPVYQLQVEAIDVPSLVIAGETFTASYRISNRSNAALEVGFGAESRRGYRIRPAGGVLSLAPGAAETIELRVETEDAGRGLRDTLSLSAEALDGALSDGAERSIEVVPRISAGEETHYRIPTWFTTSFGGQVRDGEQTTGMQLSWAGAGPLDDTGERFLSFMIRGPDMTGETILGRREELWLAYRGRDLDLTLGDRSYWLSPLTEQGRYGRGGGLRWRQGRWQISAFHLREEFTERDLEDALWEDDVEDAWGLEAGLQHDDLWWGSESGLGVGLALTPDWTLGLNLLHKHDNEGRNTVSTLQTSGLLPGDVLLDLELGVSDGDLGHGRGLFAALAHSGEALRYRVKLYHADPRFKGYYRDQRYLGAEFDYQAATSPWDIRGYYRRQRLNLDLEPERSAPLDEDMLLGVGYVWPGGDRLGLDLRHRHIRDLQPETDTDAVKRSLRLDFSKRLPALDLSLAGNLELGHRRNEHEGSRYDTLEYRLAGHWRASRRASVGGYLRYNDDATTSASREKRMTAGISTDLALTERLALQLNAETDVLGEHRRQRLNAQLGYQRDNGHLIALDARHDRGVTYDDSNLLLSYSMPIELPVGRRTDVATVRGRIFDEQSGRGLSNVVLKLDRVVAVSDAEGYFSFPAVNVKRYELKVAGGSIPSGMIPNRPLPVAVNARYDDSCPIDIPYIRGASLAGQVQLYAPAADLLPSQTFRGRRGAVGGQREIGRDDLKLRGGVAQVLVTITDGEETMRRVTNPNGDFRFVGLKPGTWTVSLHSDGLPENASAVEDRFTFELEPGEAAEASFRVEQRIRRMRMLSPLKVSAVAEAAPRRAA
jgi:hypothetical protein